MDLIDPGLEAYLDAHTSAPPPFLAALAEETRSKLTSFGMMVGAVEGRFLEMLVFACHARRVLEIGTFTGYSSLAMAAGLPHDGTIVTCELSEEHASIAHRHIQASPYADRITIRVGPALETLAHLDGPFDFVFIDADKPNYAHYFEAVLPKLDPGGIIAVDNTLWSGRVLDDSDGSVDAVAIRAFNDRLIADERVVCVQLSVRDGVTLIRKA